MKVSDLLDNVPKAIALLSATALLLTIVHDWGYFWIVGNRYLSIQTPYDHLTNSIEWLPQALLSLCLGFVISIGLEQIASRTAEGNFDRARIKRRRQRF